MTAQPRGGDIRLRGLGVTFGTGARDRLQALEDVDLQVAPGSVVALIGPNGCGKSTLLRAISGLIRPTVGTVSFDGARVDGPDPRIGLVFQEPRLLPWRSAAANIAYPLELAGWPPDRRARRLVELEQLVGIDPSALPQRPFQLSGGTGQRVALARALALEPEVLLLDEPFSALDALTRERFDLELLALWERSATTIVLVTHSIAEAILVADRVVVLSPRPGHVVAEVPVDLPRPRSVAALDGAAFSRTAAAIRAALGDVTSADGTGHVDAAVPEEAVTLRAAS
ncbi:MAG TPA: ABC transporter ATP-binding protein [Candidatus Limnocylindrales bacterium]|jgi:NitT/TauT family transport system ATP-binding protein